MTDSREEIALTLPPTFWQVLAAPWLSIVRPEEAGLRMARASGVAVVCAIVLTSSMLAVSSIAINLWDRTEQWRQIARHPYVVGETRPLQRVWSDWVEDDFEQLPIMLIGTLVYISLSCIVGAVLLLPRVLSVGNVRTSLDAGGRAIAAAGGPALLLAAVVQITAALSTDRAYELQVKSRFLVPVDGQSDDLPGALLALAPWVCMALWLAWVTRAARGARDVLPVAENTLMCEECGYQLTHQSESGRCTECGATISQSTHPTLARRDTPWDRGPSPWSWVTTTGLALFHPSKLYRMARVRGDDRRSAMFALTHYGALGLILFASFRLAEGPDFGLSMASTRSADAILKAGWMMVTLWLLHRGLGMVIMLIAAKSSWISPGVRAGKIVDYQVVFLWPLTLVGGLYFVTIGVSPLFFMGGWVGSGGGALAWIPALVAPPGLAVLLQQFVLWGPPVLLGLFWLRRYALAFRAVRWANF